MSDPATVRAQIAAALEVVLPGRVSPFPPTTKRYVTPSMFVEQASISPTAVAVVGSFPVWVLADGAIQAQLAEHDDIVWNALLALAPLADAVDARPQQLAGLRATVITVAVTLDVLALCGLPSPARAEIPPLTMNS